MRATGPAQERRRWLGLGALALMGSALIPVAIAMACNPQAYLSLDRAQYAPGDTVRVSGSFFRANAQVTVSIAPGGQSSTVTTSGNGAFQTTFALPANASGGYSVQAIGYESNGDVVAGLPARASFSVAAAQTAPPASAPSAGGQTSGGSAATAPQGGQPAAAPATRPTQPPAASRPAASRPSSSFREPSVFPEPGVQTSSASLRATGRGSATSRRSAPATANGRAVFGGSVAPAVSVPVPAAAATPAAQASQSSRAVRPRGSSSESGRVSRQAAAQTAADDVWGALSSGRSPSVLPIAGDGVAVSSPRAGSQLALGLMLLGAGVLALVGGLAVGEARRRRVRAR